MFFDRKSHESVVDGTRLGFNADYLWLYSTKGYYVGFAWKLNYISDNLLLNCRFLLVRRAKYALGAIRKKISNDNPHVTMYALQVGALPLESILNVDSAESFWFGSAGAWMCCQELWVGHSCWDCDSRIHGLHEGYGTCEKCSLLTTATYLWLTSIAVFAEASGSGARESLWVGASVVARLSLGT